MNRANYQLDRISNTTSTDSAENWMLQKKFEYAINEQNNRWRLEIAKENNASRERIARHKREEIKENNASKERIARLKYEAIIDSNQTKRHISDNRRFGGKTEAVLEDVENMFGEPPIDTYDTTGITDEKIDLSKYYKKKGEV